MKKDFNQDYAYLLLRYGDIVPTLIRKLMLTDIEYLENDPHNDMMQECKEFVTYYNIFLNPEIIMAVKHHGTYDMFADLLIYSFRKERE